MLHKRVHRLPAERLSEFLGADRLVGELQLVEHPLQRQRHRLGRVVVLGGHFVHSLATHREGAG